MENFDGNLQKPSKDIAETSTNIVDVASDLGESFENRFSTDRTENSFGGDTNSKFPTFPSSRLHGLDIMSIVMKRRLGGSGEVQQPTVKKGRYHTSDDTAYDETDSFDENQKGNVEHCDKYTEIYDGESKYSSDLRNVNQSRKDMKLYVKQSEYVAGNFENEKVNETGYHSNQFNDSNDLDKISGKNNDSTVDDIAVGDLKHNLKCDALEIEGMDSKESQEKKRSELPSMQASLFDKEFSEKDAANKVALSDISSDFDKAIKHLVAMSKDDTKKSRKQNKPRRLTKEVHSTVKIKENNEGDAISVCDDKPKNKVEKSRKQYIPQRIVRDPSDTNDHEIYKFGDEKEDKLNNYRNTYEVDDNLKDVENGLNSVASCNGSKIDDEEETYSSDDFQFGKYPAEKCKDGQVDMDNISRIYAYGNMSPTKCSIPKSVGLNAFEQNISPRSWTSDILTSFTQNLLPCQSSGVDDNLGNLSNQDCSGTANSGANLEGNLEIVRKLREIRFNKYRKISMSEKKQIAGFAKLNGVSSAATQFGVSKSAVSMWTRMDFTDVEDDVSKKKRNCMIGNKKFEQLVAKVKQEKHNKFKGLTKYDKFEVSRYAKLVGVREMARCLSIALGTVSGWMRQFPYNLKLTNESSEDLSQLANEISDKMPHDEKYSLNEVGEIHECIEDLTKLNNKDLCHEGQEILVKMEKNDEKEYCKSLSTIFSPNKTNNNCFAADKIHGEEGNNSSEIKFKSSNNGKNSKNDTSENEEGRAKKVYGIVNSSIEYSDSNDGKNFCENTVDQTDCVTPYSDTELCTSDNDKCVNKKSKKIEKSKAGKDTPDDIYPEMDNLKKDEVDKLIAETLINPDPEKCFSDIKEMIVGTPLENDSFFEKLFRRVVKCRMDKYKSLKASEKLEVVRYAKRNGVRRIAKILGLATGTLSGWNTKYQAHLGLTMDTSVEATNDSFIGPAETSTSNVTDLDSSLCSASPQGSHNAPSTPLLSESFGNFGVSNTMSPSMMSSSAASQPVSSLLDSEEKSEVTAIKFLFKEQYPVLLQKIEIARKIKFRNISPNEKIEIVKCAKLVGIRPTARVLNMPIGTLSGWITKYSDDLHPVYHVEGEENMDVRPLHFNQKFPLSGLISSDSTFPNTNASHANLSSFTSHSSLPSSVWSNQNGEGLEVNAGFDVSAEDVNRYSEMARQFSNSISHVNNVYKESAGGQGNHSDLDFNLQNQAPDLKLPKFNSVTGPVSATKIKSEAGERDIKPDFESADFDVEAKVMANHYLQPGLSTDGVGPKWTQALNWY